MIKETISVPPTSRIIRWWREDSRITLEMVVKELVDNGFDWGATEIKVFIYTDNDVQVIDNGRGIQDMQQALQLGNSANDYGSQRLGRYGIALKKGPARLGRILDIDTRTKNRHTKVWLDWRMLEYINSSDWEVPTEYELGNYEPWETGTTVTIRKLYPHRIHDWRNLRPKLAATFSPALLSGRRIFINDKPVEYQPVEGFVEKIDTQGITGCGLMFELQAGILPEGRKANNGFSIAFNHRVVVDRWVPNFMSKCALGSFHGEILLVDGTNEDECWSLTEFKDDFEPWQKKELEEALEPLVAELLKKLEQQKLTLQIGVLERFIEKLLNGGDQQRLTPNKEGAKVIKDRGGHGGKGPGPSPGSQDKTLGSTQNTPRADGKKTVTGVQRRFQLEFDSLYEDPRMWVLKPCEPLVFTINRCHPKGAELEEDGKAGNMKALVNTVVLGLASYLTTRPDAAKSYPFLLNGTDDLHTMMCENASEWLREAELLWNS